MKRSVRVTLLGLTAATQVAVAQPFPSPDTLTPQQLRGRDLFNQSCLVCHVKLQITSPAKYGPDLSQKAMGGQEAAIRKLITNGTPNMPAFKYHFTAEQIEAVASYVKALPAPSAKP
jgi:mono/diheme cytochrome c family protein